MIKVKIEKQNDKEVEFVKEVEFQLVPQKGETIEIDGNLYVVKSIRQSPDFFIVTVRDKSHRGFTNVGLLSF